jgi:hypothetical protein
LNVLRFLDVESARPVVWNAKHDSSLANQNFTPLARQEGLMALGHDYELQDCPIARALELVSER